MTYTAKNSKIENFISSTKHSVFLIFAPDKGGAMAYYFVMVKPKMEQSFLQSVTSGPTYIENFGSIIFSGFGSKIPPSVQKFMTKRYGIKLEMMAAA
jgi:hypothetical protein